jgi:hypothetical protein
VEIRDLFAALPFLVEQEKARFTQSRKDRKGLTARLKAQNCSSFFQPGGQLKKRGGHGMGF